MEMDMSTYKFSLLTNNQHLSFNPDVDTLRFNSASITASAVRLVQSGANLGFTYGGKTVWLDGTSIGELSISPNIAVTFANGSALVTGDGTSYTLADYYRQVYTPLFSTSTVGNQVWGLGGADILEAGSGADWLVGNVAQTSLNHVSRVGNTGSPNGSSSATISADGKYVAFAGGWTEFGSTNNNSTDVFVKNMVSGTVSDEHRNSAGTNGNSGSGAPVISADGTVLAYLSASSNLVAGPSSGALYDIYLSDVNGNGIERVSTGTGGTLATNGRSLNPDLSGDGRYVVFESTTSNWASGGSAATTDIFLKDRSTGTLTRISTSLTGKDGNGDSINAKISVDGNLVVFESAAKNLTSGDTNGYTDIFIWDRRVSSLINLSDLMDPETIRNPNNSSNAADIAGWGRVIVFQTAKALVGEDTANNTDIYAFDFSIPSKPVFRLVSSTSSGDGVQLGSEDASISGDGRFVVFTSYSDALVPGDVNGTSDIFVKDLQTGRIALVSKSAAGVAGNGPSSHAEISLGGEWIVFESSASNLAGTDDNSTFTDVFRVSNPLLKDTLIGGAGNDTYVLNRTDIVREQLNGGIDTISSSISYSLVDTDGGGKLGGNVENLTLTGIANLNGTGNALNNVIKGNAGNNVMNGGAGIDTVSYAAATKAVTVSLALTSAQSTGGAGSDKITNFENLTGSAFADILSGNTGNNRIDGGLGNDRLTGGLGKDTLIGSDGSDRIVGGLGNDRLTGGLGKDTLIGSEGKDRLTGGGGTDVFVLNSKVGSDTIIDFVSGTDDLRISQSALKIGDGDQLVEGALTRSAPGGFSPDAELVIFSANLASLSATAAAAAIGKATAAYTVDDQALFAVDNGTNSQLYLFTAADANAQVSAGELTLLGTLNGTASTAVGDYLFGA